MTEGNASQFVIYQSEDGQIKLDVRFVDEPVWLTQQQLAELFQTSRTNVVEHSQHVYEEGELDAAATCRGLLGKSDHFRGVTKMIASGQTVSKYL